MKVYKDVVYTNFECLSYDDLSHQLCDAWVSRLER